MTAHLIQGDARRLPLATGSVQCVITSPPYFGLRSYGGQVSVWGGDSKCLHTLADDPARRPMSGGTGGASAKQVTNAGSQFGNAWAEKTRTSEIRTGLGQAESPASTRGGAQKCKTIPKIVAITATCTLCGAWRGELGSEPTPAAFVAHLVEVFAEVWRVLRPDGVAFINMGSSYAGSGKGPTTAASTLMNGRGAADGTKVVERTAQLRQGFINQVSTGRPKSDMLIPFRLAIALDEAGWIVRQVLIWAKPNPMPESVRDRWTSSHEYILMLVKQGRYYFDQEAIREPSSSPEQEQHNQRYAKVYEASDGNAENRQPGNVNSLGIHSRPGPGGRNGRSVWNIPTAQYPGAHYATFNPELPRRCILAASREGDVVLDPFSGSGTTAFVAASLGRVGVGVELSWDYLEQTRYGRLAQGFLPLAPAAAGLGAGARL